MSNLRVANVRRHPDFIELRLNSFDRDDLNTLKEALDPYWDHRDKCWVIDGDDEAALAKLLRRLRFIIRREQVA